MDGLQGDKWALSSNTVCVHHHLSPLLEQTHYTGLKPEHKSRTERLYDLATCTAAEIGPFAGVAVVCLAFQSCENNRVCPASSLSRWSVRSGPSDRMAHIERVEQRSIWVRGTPLAGTTWVLTSMPMMAAMTKQTGHRALSN